MAADPAALDRTAAALRALFRGDGAPAEGAWAAGAVEALVRGRWRVLRLGGSEPAPGFLDPGFAAAAAAGDRAVALRSLGLAAPVPGVSPRTLDNRRTLREGRKSLLCPFTGAVVAARAALGREWFLQHGPGGEPCLASQLSPVMVNVNTEAFWVFPERDLILLARDAHPEERVRAETARRLDLCLRHAPALARHIAGAGAGPARVAATDFPCPHMSHNLWNLQTGWANLLSDPADLARIDRLFRFRGQDFFGAVGELYPEAKADPARTILAVDDDEHVFRQMLRHGLLLATVKDEHVTPDLADRILRRARRVVGEAALAEVAALRARARPLVVITIRLDNRAWIEQPEGFVALFAALRGEFPGIGVVVDGLSGDTPKGWTTGWMSLEAEQAVAGRIMAGLEAAGIPSVSAVGRRFAEALLLQDAADLFIAPSGSGMALYKWISNRPGLAFSNRFVLREGEGANWALRVWHNPAFRADVVPTVHLAPECVTDVAVPGREEAGRANFHLDWQDLHRAAVPLIRTVLGEG